MKQETPEKKNIQISFGELNLMLIPSKSYKKSVPMMISIGASSIDVKIRAKYERRNHEPTREKRCHANSLTLSTSVVIRVII